MECLVTVGWAKFILGISFPFMGTRNDNFFFWGGGMHAFGYNVYLFGGNYHLFGANNLRVPFKFLGAPFQPFGRKNS